MARVTLQCPRCGEKATVLGVSTQVAHACKKRIKGDPAVIEFVKEAHSE